MSTFGTYWAEAISLKDAQVALIDGLMFTACRHIPSLEELEYYTEFDDLLDIETQFLASMMLAVGVDEGAVTPYPASESFVADFEVDLAEPTFQIAAASALREEMNKTFRLPTAPHVPLGNGDCKYQFYHRPLKQERFARIFAGIDPADDLLMRGLHALLKSQMISRHHQFTEEAGYALYVSLDALFSLTLRYLVSIGHKSPSSYDAQRLVHDLAGEEQSGMRFFEDFYEDRVMTVHPDNRYGVFRHAPISHCDVYTLFESLRDVYRELILLNAASPTAAQQARIDR